MGYLMTDGDHDSEQADRVLCIDGRPRGRRALLIAVVDDMAPASLDGAWGKVGEAGKVGGGHVVRGGGR